MTIGKSNSRNNMSKQSAIVKVVKRIMFRVWFFRLLLVMAVAICEDKHMRNHPAVVNLWLIIFEIISAYSKYMHVYRRA
jgi:hypothetical protein